MEYSDYPMPKSYPDFPHHTQIAAYFDDYVDHFGFRERITFETGVEHAAAGRRRRLDGRARHRREPRATTRCSSPTATTGIRAGRSRAFPGHFDGVQMHSHHYIDNTDFADKNVLVVGIGNSAMDIAVESSFVARRTFLSSRRGAPTSCPSTCSAGRSTRSGSTR